MATTDIYTLSLHDALPISGRASDASRRRRRCRPSDPHRDDRPRSESEDRKSTRLNSSHGYISYAVFCLKKKKKFKTMNSILDTIHYLSLNGTTTVFIAVWR